MARDHGLFAIAAGSWLGLPAGVLCTAGAAGSFCAMFYQVGDLWQIAKPLLLLLRDNRRKRAR
jgi:hypothetical protein